MLWFLNMNERGFQKRTIFKLFIHHLHLEMFY